jgi:hypothetical protein
MDPFRIQKWQFVQALPCFADTFQFFIRGIGGRQRCCLDFYDSA